MTLPTAIGRDLEDEMTIGDEAAREAALEAFFEGQSKPWLFVRCSDQERMKEDISCRLVKAFTAYSALLGGDQGQGEDRGRGAPTGTGYSGSTPSPQAVSACGEYPSPAVPENLRSLSAEATPGPWYTVDPPWSNGSWIVAGNPDPHVGVMVCDCYDINDSRTEREEATGVTQPSEQDDAAFIAAAANFVRSLIAAQGIEARSDETRNGSAVGESPVPANSGQAPPYAIVAERGIRSLPADVQVSLEWQADEVANLWANGDAALRQSVLAALFRTYLAASRSGSANSGQAPHLQPPHPTPVSVENGETL